MNILEKLLALWRSLWNRERGLEAAAPTLPPIEGPVCDVRGCGRAGTYNVGDPGDHVACAIHAQFIVDRLLAGFSDAFNECQRLEEEGAFLPKDTSRGFEVYKSKGSMGDAPRIPR